MASDLDNLLYQWIRRANDRRDDLDLPVGFVEDSIALLKRILGGEYLEQILIKESEPVHFLDDEANPLRKWLLSAMVDQHIIQVMELASYLREFQDDPALPDKIDKLTRDRFWPVFFELAMATRVKRASFAPQAVVLNHEAADSIGDFTIHVPGYSIPCECSRLGRSPQVTEPQTLQESLSKRIGDGTQDAGVPLCIKIRSTEPLTGATYNRVLQLLRRAFSDLRRLKLPTTQNDGSTVVTIEELTAESEKVPSERTDDKGNAPADWDSVEQLCRVPAVHVGEIADRFEKGERFYQYEAVRSFSKFGPPAAQTDSYSRLTSKLKKKLKQTKTTTEHFGKIVLIEVPFDLRAVDANRLREAVREAAMHSRSALAVILANREANPQVRYHYSQSGIFNQTAAAVEPELIKLLERTGKNEITVDPLVGSPYRRSWGEAQMHAAALSERRVPG